MVKRSKRQYTRTWQMQNDLFILFFFCFLPFFKLIVKRYFVREWSKTEITKQCLVQTCVQLYGLRIYFVISIHWLMVSDITKLVILYFIAWISYFFFSFLIVFFFLLLVSIWWIKYHVTNACVRINYAFNKSKKKNIRNKSKPIKLLSDKFPFVALMIYESLLLCLFIIWSVDW